MLRRSHGFSAIHEITNRKVTARRPEFPHTALSRLLQLPQVCHAALARPPCGGDIAVWLRRCAFWKAFNVKLKETQSLRAPCGELKTVRSPFGLHKNHKTAVRFGELRSPTGHRKHTATNMWLWPYALCGALVFPLLLGWTRFWTYR